MAYDPQMPSDSEVFSENGFDVGIEMEDLSKVLETENLQAADEAKEDADEEEDDGSVEPRAELKDAGNCVAQDKIPQEGDAGSTGTVPPYLVCTLCREAGEHEDE